MFKAIKEKLLKYASASVDVVHDPSNGVYVIKNDFEKNEQMRILALRQALPSADNEAPQKNRERY